MSLHSSSVTLPCVVRQVLLGISGVLAMNVIIVAGTRVYEATWPFTSGNFKTASEADPAAIYMVAVKEGFEVDVGVGWDAPTARSEALIRAFFAQHFGTTT